MDRRRFLGASLAWLAFWRSDRRLAGIKFRVIKGAHSGRRFLLIHGNESTAREVLTEHIKSARGVAYLVLNSKRNVPFKAGELDPNRMFSHEGAERNLHTLNPGWPEAQIISGGIVLDRKRHELIDAVRPRGGDVLIAVHNNSEGYSVTEEVPISNATALNDAPNPHEFCLCTDAGDYALLSKGKYNVVLQNKPAARDDGSLSRLAAVEGFRYVNIEAGLGKSAKQKAMLQWVDDTLPRGK